MSCCPPEALPYLQSEGTPKGLKKRTNDCEFYESCSSSSSASSKALIIIPDVWGWDSGRIRKLGDYFAETAGFLYAFRSYLILPIREVPMETLYPQTLTSSREGRNS